MAFKRVTIVDIWELIRRSNDGQNISSIAGTLGNDRKTIRKYLNHLKAKGVQLGMMPVDKEQLMPLLQDIVSESERPAAKQMVFEPYLKELVYLVNEKGLKPKTAFRVVCQKNELEGKVSYSSFKRYARRNHITLTGNTTTCRIEVPAGSQMQIDYCKAGLLPELRMNRQRVVYAFILTLSFSRHKYVEFVYSQDQQSFVSSHVNAFNFFGGVPRTGVLDNLKAGVISPSLYDPQFNRSYREMAEYYGCFLDPARVRHPKDKGKVERDVQTVREKFKELLALDPSITLPELNQAIRQWLLNDYGMRKHGTTGREPYLVFLQEEKPQLLPLPAEPFEAAFWKEATVHPDHYIQVRKKSYSVPHRYVGKKVWAKITHNTVQIYYNEELIKQHPIALGHSQTDQNDFPENLRFALDTGLPRQLQNVAAGIGPNFAQLIRNVLSPHAYMNLRRAFGLIDVGKAYPREIIERASGNVDAGRGLTPRYFRAFVEKLLSMEAQQAETLPVSEETRSFTRPVGYFIH